MMLAASIACLAFAGCARFHPRPAGSFEFATDSKFLIYSSITETYARSPCTRDHAVVEAQVRLSDSEMSSIFAEAQRIGFYKLPGNMQTDFYDPAHDRITVVAPCPGYRLRIESGEQHNDVAWNCGLIGWDPPPERLAPLVSMISKILASKPEIRALPPSECHLR